MRRLLLLAARCAPVVLLTAVGSLSCDSGSTSGPTSTVDTRVGTVRAHQLAFVNFAMTRPGLVTLRIDPVLLLTLRSGKVPEEFGVFITSSDIGALTFEAPAGTNSVVIGNPFDADKAFTLTIDHP